jgi:SIR2-like domain
MNCNKVSLFNQSRQAITQEAECLISTFLCGEGGAPTVFVGSGISIWEPSDLPSGQDFTRAMFSVLFDDSLILSLPEKALLEEIFGKRWSPYFSGMPFEHLMECCPSEVKANQLVNRLYNSRRPNPLHRALAKGLREGKIHSIITTNYDCCLDEALDDEGFSFVKVATSAQASGALGVSGPCYFKIHGSVESGLETSPMFLLKHEGLLHPYKRALLAQLVERRRLVMIGYSGLDFELCPEIERLVLADLVWNNLRDHYPSVSAERVIGIKKGTLLYGDMRGLLKHWLGMPDQPDIAPSREADVRKAAREIFDNEEISLWRVRVLNSLGLPSFTLKALEAVGDSSPPFFFNIEQGRAQFNAGFYKTSRRHFKRAFFTALATQGWHHAADAALETSDAYRTGAPLRAYLCTWAVEILLAKRLTAKKYLKQSLVIRDIIEISNSLQEGLVSQSWLSTLIRGACRALTKALRDMLSRKLLKCAKEALQTGNWIDFQQVALIAEGMGINVAAEGEFYPPPKAAEGYRHLGYYIPQTIVFTNECLKDNRRLAANPELRREWRHHVRICQCLGINSGLWKVLALSPSRKIKIRARETFRRCEYGILKGFFDWKKYSARSEKSLNINECEHNNE